jgi:hypothetical protein
MAFPSRSSSLRGYHFDVEVTTADSVGCFGQLYVCRIDSDHRAREAAQYIAGMWVPG